MGNDTAKLSPTVMTDLIEKTTFEADEIHTFYREFEKGCATGSLAMTREEFKTMYSKWFPNGDPATFADHVFNTFDLDNKDRVRFRDVLAMLTINLKGTMEQRLEWTFNLYDIGNTGYIERRELLDIIKSMHRIKANALPAESRATPNQICDYIMEKADSNKDGRISRQGFLTAAMQSKTIQNMLVGTLVASSSPFLGRKHTRSPKGTRERSGSTRSETDSPPAVPKSYNLKA